MDDREERIRQRAYGIWEREGRPEGRHDDHWNEAERGDVPDDGTAPIPSGIPQGDMPPQGRTERAHEEVAQTAQGGDAQAPEGYAADIDTTVTEADRTFTPSPDSGANIDADAGGPSGDRREGA